MQANHAHIARLLSLVLGLTAVIALSLNARAVRATRGTNPSRSLSSQQEQSLSEELIRLELGAWEAVKKKDKAALGRVLADDYLDFGSDGRWDIAKSLREGCGKWLMVFTQDSNLKCAGM
jgi:hypothetical protein